MEDDLTAGLKEETGFAHEDLVGSEEGPHRAGAEPVASPRDGKYASSSILMTFFGLISVTSSRMSSAEVELAVVTESSTELGVAVENSVGAGEDGSSAALAWACFNANNSAGVDMTESKG